MLYTCFVFAGTLSMKQLFSAIKGQLFGGRNVVLELSGQKCRGNKIGREWVDN